MSGRSKITEKIYAAAAALNPTPEQVKKAERFAQRVVHVAVRVNSLLTSLRPFWKGKP